MRFLGARFDEEIVLLDRETNSLIRLDRDAVAVWEGRVNAPRCAAETTTNDEGVWAALRTAGLVRNVSGRSVSAAIEWV
ncbi:MAG TPA: hypothetical protein VJT33_17930 [bacterium]|nr:hypothetical protein [bacterium]